MGGDTPSTTTQISKTELPEWVNNAGTSNYQSAVDIANKPYEAYDGQRVADLSKATQDALNLAGSSAGQYSGNFTGASSALQGLLGQGASQAGAAPTVTAGTVAGSDLSKYLDPYTNNVVDASLSDLDRTRQAALNQNASKAGSTGAFGGSRQAITDAVTNSESARQAGNLSASLRDQAFNTATGLLTGDLNRTLSADTTNASNATSTNLANLGAKTANNQNQVAASTALTNAGTAGQASNLADISSLLNAGSIQQDHNQKQLDQQYADYLDKKNYDVNNLNLKLSTLGLTPYGQTTSSTKTTDTGNNSDWATAALGGLSLLKGFGAFSEDTEKVDKQKVGKIPGSPLNAWAYRYKGDPKSYPKVVGLMASEVEEHRPHAIKKVGKKRIVDYTKALQPAGEF